MSAWHLKNNYTNPVHINHFLPELSQCVLYTYSVIIFSRYNISFLYMVATSAGAIFRPLKRAKMRNIAHQIQNMRHCLSGRNVSKMGVCMSITHANVFFNVSLDAIFLLPSCCSAACRIVMIAELLHAGLLLFLSC